MSRIKYYLEDSLCLNTVRDENGEWNIHLANGETVNVAEKKEYNGAVWEWQVNGQLFDDDRSALDYLTQIIAEKMTGKRVVLRAMGSIPDICGYEGRACRHPGKCNSFLCNRCPVADKFFADRDGVELIYAI